MALETTMSFPRLSSNNGDIHAIYDVIVIGSGYGGAIAACRAARANQGVCVLEKGKEWQPGDFPETLSELKRNVHVTKNGKETFGERSSLFDVQMCDGATILSAVGLGGRSLTATAVSYEPQRSVFQKDLWPSVLRRDIDNVLGVDAERVRAMLDPSKWPDTAPYTELKKSELLCHGAEELSGVDIEDMGKYVKQLPLWINFKHGPNSLGIQQPACNGCGNCLSGCNTGAKNTLNLNYLADAKAHGAHIFTETEATTVCRDSYTGLWSVEFKQTFEGSIKDHTVKARLVFIAAGVTGSAKILFQSKEKGLAVSQKLGHNMSLNGFTSGICNHLTDDVRSFGLGKDEDVKGAFKPTNPGPTSTIVIEFSSESDEGFKGVISDLTLPGALKLILPVILNAESGTAELRKLLESGFKEPEEQPKNSSAGNFLSICATTRTKNFGQISFDASKESVTFKMLQTNSDSSATTKMEELSNILEGDFVKCPEELTNGHFSMYPLGGCIMAENGYDGVVNHKGQVFVDNTSDVYDGLYVVGGSVIPCYLPVNPSFTVCALAERCMRLCAADFAWRMDYDVSQEIANELDTRQDHRNHPGLVMTEKMVGDVTIKSTGNKSYCDFVLDFKVNDIVGMIETDPEHSGSINGTVTCPGLSKEPLAAKGILKLLKDSTDQVDGKEMIYSMALTSVESKMFYFFGIKYVHLDEFAETGLRDTTTLFVTIYEGKDISGEMVAEGVLYMRFKDFAKQLTTISVTRANSVIEKWKLEAKFVKFFLKGLWDTYFRLTGGSLLDPEAPPRVKRSLKLGDKNPEFYKAITDDKVELRLTRLQGGKKGPIMLVHGLGVASNLFLVDTVEQNFVEFLIENKYDVWLFDWRTSLLLPWACYSQYSVDECAQFDFSAGVNKVLEVTKEKDVQLVVHCFGAIAAIASVLLGKLEGKVRCILTSQVSATPVGSLVNKFKSQSCLSSLFAKSGVTSLTAYVDKDSPWSEKTLNHMTRNFAYVTTKADQHCSSEVCHRITFLYGLLFEHGNLNLATHDILHELFGVATTKILSHTALITRKERVVSFEGKDIYLPGYKKRNRLADPRFRRKMDLLNFPIMFFNGERNSCWNPENLVRCYNMVREANPNQDYVYYEAEGYGHLDTFLGKKSHLDIYPKLVQWLDKYADDHDVKDKGLKTLIFGALDQSDEHTNVQRTKSGNERLNLIQSNDLDESKEIKADVGKGNELEKASLVREKTEDFIQHQENPEISQLPHGSETEDSDEIEVEEERLLWQRKDDGRSCFHRHERYKDPVSTDAERVVIESFKLEDDAKRRDILTISDLHLGSDWSRNIKPRLESFVASLTELATSTLHSVVLLGNIFDMTATAVAVTPPTADEFMVNWKNDQVVTSFIEAVQKITANNAVRVYYVRGDSDHDMTEQMAKELFGDNINYVPGCLIYKLYIGDKLYTIRFEHGHSADLFSDHSINMFASKEIQRPFSYFIKRFLFSTEDRFFLDSKEVINKYVKGTLKTIPPCSVGSTYIDILATKLFSKRFYKNLVEKAIGKHMTGEECIIMEEGKWIRLSSIFECKFLNNALAKYGSSEVYNLLQSSVKDLSHYVKQCHEDLVIMGHLHKRLLRRIHTKGGETIYANTGTWIDLASHSSYVKIQPPKTFEHGLVELFAVEN